MPNSLHAGRSLSELNELSSRLWHSRTLNEGLEEMLAAVLELLGAPMGNVQLLDPERSVLHIAAHHGFDREFLEFFREVTAADDSACGRALRTRRRVIVEDVEADPHFAPYVDAARVAGFRAVQTTPLISRDGAPLGAISTHFRLPHRPSDAEFDRLDIYVRQAVDFIERSRSEETLRASEQRFRDMADTLRDREAELALVARATPVVLTRCSRDMRYLYINAAGAKVLGRTPEQVIGQSVRDVMDEQAFAVVEPHIQRVLRGETVEYEEKIPYGPGALWMRVTYVPDVAEDGEVAGWIGSIVDITERKQAELEASRLFATLQESDRRKDEFIAILAHELRNPLAPVRNASHYLKLRELADPELQKAVDLVDRQVGMMSRLIEDLLDVSRISRGMLELRREPVPVAELVQSAVDSCRHEIDGRGHALRLSLPADPLLLHGDRARLTQALCNLITNAVKFSEPGGPMEVDARVSDGHVLISVRDQGKGIPHEKLDKIFELFVQLDRTLERQGGLGIGLTLTRQIVELHGGTIEARSEGLGRGSEFLMRLPIGVVLDARSETAAVKPNVAARRILVVDDNADTVDSLATALEFSGHRVDKAFDGVAAFDATQRLLPDLVLLDIGMPKMNGYDVARRIREQPWGGRIHLVALTGWGHEDDKRRAREAGFDAHLVKPVAFEAIERILAGLPA